MSELRPIFYNSPIFQSNFLQRVKIGVNFFTDPQILNRKFYNSWSFKLNLLPENQILLEDFFQKIIFWVVLHHWNVKVNFLALSWKCWFRDEQFGKKTYFAAKFVKSVKFNHFLVLFNFWNETSTACQSDNQTLVFTTWQIFNQPFYYPSDLNRIF